MSGSASDSSGGTVNAWSLKNSARNLHKYAEHAVDDHKVAQSDLELTGSSLESAFGQIGSLRKKRELNRMHSLFNSALSGKDKEIVSDGLMGPLHPYMQLMGQIPTDLSACGNGPLMLLLSWVYPVFVLTLLVLRFLRGCSGFNEQNDGRASVWSGVAFQFVVLSGIASLIGTWVFVHKKRLLQTVIHSQATLGRMLCVGHHAASSAHKIQEFHQRETRFIHKVLKYHVLLGNLLVVLILVAFSREMLSAVGADEESRKDTLIYNVDESGYDSLGDVYVALLFITDIFLYSTLVSACSIFSITNSIFRRQVALIYHDISKPRSTMTSLSVVNDMISKGLISAVFDDNMSTDVFGDDSDTNIMTFGNIGHFPSMSTGMRFSSITSPNSSRRSADALALKMSISQSSHPGAGPLTLSPLDLQLVMETLKMLWAQEAMVRRYGSPIYFTIILFVFIATTITGVFFLSRDQSIYVVGPATIVLVLGALFSNSMFKVRRQMETVKMGLSGLVDDHELFLAREELKKFGRPHQTHRVESTDSFDGDFEAQKRNTFSRTYSQVYSVTMSQSNMSFDASTPEYFMTRERTERDASLFHQFRREKVRTRFPFVVSTYTHMILSAFVAALVIGVVFVTRLGLSYPTCLKFEKAETGSDVTENTSACSHIESIVIHAERGFLAAPIVLLSPFIVSAFFITVRRVAERVSGFTALVVVVASAAVFVIQELDLGSLRVTRLPIILSLLLLIVYTGIAVSADLSSSDFASVFIVSHLILSAFAILVSVVFVNRFLESDTTGQVFIVAVFLPLTGYMLTSFLSFLASFTIDIERMKSHYVYVAFTRFVVCVSSRSCLFALAYMTDHYIAVYALSFAEIFRRFNGPGIRYVVLTLISCSPDSAYDRTEAQRRSTFSTHVIGLNMISDFTAILVAFTTVVVVREWRGREYDHSILFGSLALQIVAKLVVDTASSYVEEYLIEKDGVGLWNKNFQEYAKIIVSMAAIYMCFAANSFIYLAIQTSDPPVSL